MHYREVLSGLKNVPKEVRKVQQWCGAILEQESNAVNNIRLGPNEEMILFSRRVYPAVHKRLSAFNPHTLADIVCWYGAVITHEQILKFWNHCLLPDEFIFRHMPYHVFDVGPGYGDMIQKTRWGGIEALIIHATAPVITIMWDILNQERYRKELPNRT
jgi:hypothetical protein